MTRKIIVTNSEALTAKYGAGASAVNTAIQELVAADSARGVETRVIALNDNSAMQAANAPVVKDSGNAKQTKEAIDAVYHALAPDYLLLVGAYDVVASQLLKNPVYEPSDPDTDPDPVIPSDLPYACEAPFSEKPEDFTGVTRVVGRLPDLMGAKEPSYLVDVLGRTARAAVRPKTEYSSYLGVSTDSWKASTRLSLTQLFGEGALLRACPVEGPEWTAEQLASRVHYFNCHGGAVDCCFYGEKEGADDFPVALDAHTVKGRLQDGTVASVECCYGAQLYDPADKDAGGQMPIGQTYLGNGAYGYMGSSTVAYGPAEGNSSADLICRFFLQHVLNGASLGRALLEARQHFVQASDSPLDPIDVKSLAQFLLLGDPSLHPVAQEGPEGESFELDFSGGRALLDRLARRRRLFVRGLEIARTLAVATSARVAERSAALDVRLRELADGAGMRGASILSFAVRDPLAGAIPPAMASRAPQATGIHVMFTGRGRRLMVVRAVEDRVVGVRELRRKSSKV